MKIFFYNFGYFLMEARRTIRFNPLSNLFSVIGTGLILFLLGLVIAGWSVGDQLIEALGEQAEISAYFDEGLNEAETQALVEEIREIMGVTNAKYIEEAEARTQMEEMLGEEAEILELFEENPFEAFIEIRISLETMDSALENISQLRGIAYVRDNREVLEQLKGITQGLKLIGSLIIAAVGITTLIIISHMIRQGIYNNKEQINTLRLLGAPNSFIGFPFVLSGLSLTLFGGILAAGALYLLIREGYEGLSGSLPFIPLPLKEKVINLVSVSVLGISAVLGLMGSLFGLSSIRGDDNN